MSEIGERTRQIIEQSPYRNIKSYADNAGIKVPTLTAMVNRDVEPRFTLIASILKASPEINAEWLMRGEGPMYKDEDVEENDGNNTESEEAANMNPTARAIEALQEVVRSQNELIKQLVSLANKKLSYDGQNQ